MGRWVAAARAVAATVEVAVRWRLVVRGVVAHARAVALRGAVTAAAARAEALRGSAICSLISLMSAHLRKYN